MVMQLGIWILLLLWSVGCRSQDRPEARETVQITTTEGKKDASVQEDETPAPGTTKPTTSTSDPSPSDLPGLNYHQRGSMAVQLYSGRDMSGFQVHYPVDLATSNKRFYIVTWGNGTMVPTFIYRPILEHIASWGFVVVATNSVRTGTGVEMVEGVQKLIALASNQDSVFFNKLEVRGACATGHSQGGKGALNAGNNPLILCSAPIQPTRAELELKGPALLIAGELDTTVPPEGVRGQYTAINSVPKIFALQRAASHYGAMLGGQGLMGYLVAWFKWHLESNQQAKTWFSGPQCVLCNDKGWQIEPAQGL